MNGSNGTNDLLGMNAILNRARKMSVRTVWMALLMVALMTVLLACGQGAIDGNNNEGQQGTGDAPVEGEELVAETEEGDFVLRVVSDKNVYKAGEEVNITAMLKYVGDEESIDIAHAASPFWFNITETTRDITIDYAMTQPLIVTTLKQGEWYEETYSKTGAYGEGDPHKDFMVEFLEGDGFPVGEYVVEVVADFSIGDDIDFDARYEISTTINIKVVE